MYRKMLFIIFCCIFFTHHICAQGVTHSGGIIQTVQHPTTDGVMPGQEFQRIIEIQALDGIADVQFKVWIEEVELIESFPSLTKVKTMDDGSTLYTYHFEKKWSKGESQRVILKLRATGTPNICCLAKAEKINCMPERINKTQLSIVKNMPTKAQINQEIPVTITVTNVGNMVAKKVILSDFVPQQMVRTDKNIQLKHLQFDCGDIYPGQSQSVSLRFRVTSNGSIINRASAIADNADEVTTSATVVVNQQPTLFVSCPPNAFTQKPSVSTCVITNPSTEMVEGLKVQAFVPDHARIIRATAGNQDIGVGPLWSLPKLYAGQSVEIKMVYVTGVEGQHPIKFQLSNAGQSLSITKECSTIWKGQPALLIELVDDPGQLVEGEESALIVNVTNQGRANDNNISIEYQIDTQYFNIVRFSNPTSMQPAVNGGKVVFPIVPTITPGQVLQWTVWVKAKQSNDDIRTKVLLRSNLLKTPVTEEESTTIY